MQEDRAHHHASAMADCEADLGGRPVLRLSNNAFLRAGGDPGTDRGGSSQRRLRDQRIATAYTDGLSTSAQQTALAVELPGQQPICDRHRAARNSRRPRWRPATTTYFNAAKRSTDLVTSSAKSYIPEVVWNDNSSNTHGDLRRNGGGVSTMTARPSWQVGVTGIRLRKLPVGAGYFAELVAQ